MDDVIRKLENLGRHGLIVSICYGECGDMGFMYSVDVMTTKGDSFDKPYGATTFTQCVEIAETESIKRGWLGTN